MKKGIYPGSFDPVTNGHLDIIKRSAQLFDTLIVAVAPNSSKTPLFSVQERMRLLEEACADIPNVKIENFEGLLVDYAVKSGCHVIIKGLRAVSDFEYELQMALTNARLCPEVETVFMMTSSEYLFLASRVVKEIARLGGSVSGLVPSAVEPLLYSKYSSVQQEPED